MPQGRRGPGKGRGFHVDDDVYEAARARAAERGETLSLVVRRAPAQYAEMPYPVTAADKRKVAAALMEAAATMDVTR